MISRMAAISGVRKAGAIVALIACGFGGSGCLAETPVTRVMDGRTVLGTEIPPSAYAAFLEGVLLEEQGKALQASTSFRISLSSSDNDPNVWSHLARAVCLSGKGDGGRELERARAIDPAFSGASLAEAACAKRRGDAAAEKTALERARSEAPFGALPSRAFATERASGVLVATLLRGEERGAWKALMEWSATHNDESLERFAWEHWLPRDTQAVREATRRVASLVSRGSMTSARRLASMVVDVRTVVAGAVDEETARLAVDDAILSGDVARVRRVSVRARVPPDETMLRAFVLGERALAEELLAERLSLGDRSPLVLWASVVFTKKASGAALPTFSAAEWPLLACVVSHRVGQLTTTEAALAWGASFGAQCSAASQ